MAVVTFRIDRTCQASQYNLRFSLPVQVQATEKSRTDYSFGLPSCRCKAVYQIHQDSLERLQWIAGAKSKGTYVCGCYGVVVARDSSKEVAA